MTKKKRIVTSVTVDPDLKRQADEIGLKLSKALDDGLRQNLHVMIYGVEDNTAKEQRDEIRNAEIEREFKRNLTNWITLLKHKYIESSLSFQDPFDEDALLKTKLKEGALDLHVPEDALQYLTVMAVDDEVLEYDERGLIKLNKEDLEEISDKLKE